MENEPPKKRWTLKELLLSDEHYRGDLNIPPRGQFRMRPPPNFDDDEGGSELPTPETHDRE